MALVAGDQVVRAGGVRTFQELVSLWVSRDLERTRRVNELGAVLCKLEELLPKASADFEGQAREHLAVFRQDS